MKNKSILITGGCGFVGTNLAIYLKKELKNFSLNRSTMVLIFEYS